MHVWVTPAMMAQCVTPTPWMAAPFAPVLLALWEVLATRTWMSVQLVSFVLWCFAFYSCQCCGHMLIWSASFISILFLWVYFIYWSPAFYPPAGANPCEHFGKCVNTEGSFQCQCGRGYAGPRCEIDINAFDRWVEGWFLYNCDALLFLPNMTSLWFSVTSENF